MEPGTGNQPARRMPAPQARTHTLVSLAAALVLILLVLGLNVGLRFLTRDRVVRSMNK